MQCGWLARFLIAGAEVRRLYFEVCNTTAEPARSAERISSQVDLAEVGSGFAGTDHNKEKKVNSRMIFRTAALAAACLLSTASVRAQATAAPGAAPAGAGKVGVISIRQAIVATAEGKQASAELQSQFAPRQTELENMNKQVNDLRQRLAACEGKCSQDQIASLTQQGQRVTAQLERKQTEYQEDVNASQGEVIDRIGRKMVDVLDRYARENGYSVILDSSSQNTPILYASTQVDVTQDIIRLFDSAYPVKAAAPAQQKPAAAKPAPTTPTANPTKP
jgi:outer membrane protein